MTSSMLFEDSEEMTTTLSPLLTDDDYSVTLGIFNATLAGLNGTTQGKHHSSPLLFLLSRLSAGNSKNSNILL